MKSLFIAFLLLGACADNQPKPPYNGPGISADQYETVLESHKASTRDYQGFYNTVEMQGVLITPDMAEAQIEQNTRLYQWDAQKIQAEKDSANTRLSSQTEIFLAFYTPERKNDNLDKVQTLWKVFLDANGKRYEAKVKKIKLLPSEILGLYPFYNKFCTPYQLTFPFPVTSLAGSPVKLTITGPVTSVFIDMK